MVIQARSFMPQMPTAVSRTEASPDQRQLPQFPSTTEIVDSPTVMGSSDVAVFWDYENVRIPAWCPATAAAEAIRNKIAKYGRIVEKRLYYDSRQPTELGAPRSDLDLSGFTLVDCPSRGRKETLDKKLIVDVLTFAWERASRGVNAARACVVLITSDGDYSYALARLRDIGVFTVIIYRPDVVAKVLIDNANVVMSWEFDVLGGPPVSQGDEDFFSATDSVSATDSIESDPESENELTEAKSKQPNLQTRGKFALFGSVVLNAQHRNVREGINVYSSWATESTVAATYYEKIGEKDREGYINIRKLATEKGFIEYGRRNLLCSGKPVIKVNHRDERTEDLSLESYVRLTSSGLSVVKPNISSKESPWMQTIATSTPAASSLSNPKACDGKLFVGGLAWATTEDSLRSYFLKFGSLQHVLVKEERGFGFVFFRNPKDAVAVLEQAGNHVVDGKSVDVKPYNRG